MENSRFYDLPWQPQNYGAMAFPDNQPLFIKYFNGKMTKLCYYYIIEHQKHLRKWAAGIGKNELCFFPLRGWMYTNLFKHKGYK
jgi:hypothetical protein